MLKLVFACTMTTAFALAISSSVCAKSDSDPSTHLKVAELRLQSAELDAYFPSPLFSDLTYDSSVPSEAAQALRTLGEAPLSKIQGVSHLDYMLRILWVSAFGHVTMIRVDGMGGKFTGGSLKKGRMRPVRSITLDRTIRLSPAIFQKIVDDASHSRIEILDNEQSIISTDGVIIVIEQYSKGKHTAIYRESSVGDPVVDFAFRVRMEIEANAVE